MKLDYALILAAGEGSRMGEIGKLLPKPLWPVFEKSILELEVLYARQLGAKKIFINTHHYKERILDFVEGNPIFEDATILIEEEKIDIGGAVHNMAERVGYRGSLLILNSDQFIFMDPELWDHAWNSFKNGDSLLFTHTVNSSQLYNGLDIREGRFQGVLGNDAYERDVEMQTYTGMSLVNLEALAPQRGMSRFFESVANPSRSRVEVFNVDRCPYWDFGTLRRYWESCQRILKRMNSGDLDLFLSFLLENKAFDPKKAGDSNYNAREEGLIHLGAEKAPELRNKIILSWNGASHLLDEGPAIVYDNVVEPI